MLCAKVASCAVAYVPMSVSIASCAGTALLNIRGALITLLDAVASTVRCVLYTAIAVELANTTLTSVLTAGMAAPIVMIGAQIAVYAIGVLKMDIDSPFPHFHIICALNASCVWNVPTFVNFVVSAKQNTVWDMATVRTAARMTAAGYAMTAGIIVPIALTSVIPAGLVNTALLYASVTLLAARVRLFARPAGNVKPVAKVM